MGRFLDSRANRTFAKPPKMITGGHHVARLFVPAYDGGITIKVNVRRSRNSDARRRLGRIFETRRMVS